MNAIETTGTDIEPAWDSFGINRGDFRPHWDGDLVNLFSTVEPLDSEPATEGLMMDCAKSIANWVTTHRDRFGKEDRFQIIGGWPKTVREAGRQAIKTGGTFEALQKIARGEQPIEMIRGWSNGIFHSKSRHEQAETGSDHEPHSN